MSRRALLAAVVVATSSLAGPVGLGAPFALAALQACAGAQPSARGPSVPEGARDVKVSLFDLDCADCADRVVVELKQEGDVYESKFDKMRVVLDLKLAPSIADAQVLAAAKRAGFRAQIGDMGGAYLPQLAAPAGADVAIAVADGHDVDLATLQVAGKITIVDFYADWCGPCRDVDQHLEQLAGARADVAYRRLNVVDWDSPLATHYMKEVPQLPYVIVFAPGGHQIDAIAGVDLARLDAAVARAKR